MPLWESRLKGTARWLAGAKGPGGVVLQLALEAGERDLLENHPWPALRRDLEPGQSEVLEVAIRRPIGPARLRIEPHILGNRGFNALGGPTWESEI